MNVHVPWRKVLQVYVFVIAVAATVTLLVAWRAGQMTLNAVADTSVMVSIGIALMSLACVGPGRFSEAERLEADPGITERRAALGNPALGALGLAGAASWAVGVNVLAHFLR